MNIKLILKGVLLYSTLLSLLFIIGAADSLYDNNCLLEAIIIAVVLVYSCKRLISKEEIKKLSFEK